MNPVNQAPTLSICIAANFTVEPIEEVLTYWMSELGIPVEIRFAPYNQVFQQLLEGGMIRANRSGINLVALDLETWLPTGPFDAARAQLERTTADLVTALRSAGIHGAGGAVLLFPPSHSSDTDERAETIAAARSSVSAACTSIAGWSAIDLAETVALYSVAETRDPFTDELGNIPFTEEMYAAAATAAARWIRAVCTKPRKVIVLDCDNTLWQGVCGEGIIEVTPPYRALQEFMLRQRDEGMLLAIVSKNNEADVVAAMESGACLLRPEHLAAWQINWEAKSGNLAALSEELGLDLATFVFLDDSSLECMEVRNRYPEVLTIQLPTSTESIPDFLQHLWVFDHPIATDEDRARASLYQAERQRTELSRRSLTVEEFLASLNIEVQFSAATPPELSRVAQLTQRTTQFNLTNVLHTEQSVLEWLDQPQHECWTVRVKDAFGDYGLVGAIMFAADGDTARVDTFLLSCRALGRGVEEQMLHKLKNWTLQRGAKQVIIPVVPSKRNRPALDFLNRTCNIQVDSDQPFDCVLSATHGATKLRSPIEQACPHAEAIAKLPVLTDEEDLLVRIATRVQTSSAVIDALRNRKKRRPPEAGPLVAPRNSLEASLAEIWSDGLGIEPIGAHDNFFDFGGQSLIATKILTRVRAEFGVELSFNRLFHHPTIEGMATQITEAQQARAAAGVQ